MIRAPIPCAELIIRPTAIQRALAYLSVGRMPPLRGASAMAFEAALICTYSSALCLAAGYLLGTVIAP